VELFRPVWELILGFCAVAALGWILRWLGMVVNRKMQMRAKDWPYTHGTVEHAEPKMVGEGRSGYWVGELAYSYSVGGEYYSGILQLPASSEDAAWDAVRGWKDRKVIVHYMPTAPSRSMLVMEEQDQPAGLPGSYPRPPA